MPNPPDRAKAVFFQALEADDPAARAALVANACTGDADLKARVEALLRAHDGAGSFLDRPAAVGPTTDPADRTADYRPADAAGLVLGGRYKLVERIGEGGMGAVWLARQAEPVKRAVAVKLIKPGMDSKQVLARFEAERQALALMDHPNIARVLDAGAAPDGRPFFVMELVKGQPITAYCDAHKLTPRERLELFVPVCQAIQHAHQKGVIHRDIKPNNVLVALYDDRPVPKVIDFGVAKATGGLLTERTIETAFGVVGTPQYMSPEQATLNNLDVDTRTDVYSLGVLLYELLTGSPPFAKADLDRKGLLEVLRVVREEEPPRPSTKLSTADALPTVSANRRTDPKKLTGMLRNELDWIVMKSLEKDRGRRYETANGFAADVQRYLAGEPVQAVPPSAGYRVRKFVRRHKGRVAAVAAVFAALVVGVVGTTWGLVQAAAERDKALTAEGNARGQATIAGQERDKARADRDEKEKAQKLEQAARAAAQERVVRLHLRTGQSATDRGEGWAGLHWFAAGWAADAPDPARQAVHRVRFAAALRNLPTLQSVRFHNSPIEAAWFSPDGRRVLTQTSDGRVFLSDADTGRLTIPPLAHPQGVVRCGFTRDGSRVFTVAFDHAVRVWDATTGRLVGPPIPPAEGKRLAAADVAPDGKTALVAGKGGGTVALVAVDSGETQKTWAVAADPVSVRFDPTGRRFAAALDATAVLWDVGKAEPVATLPHRAEAITSAGRTMPNPSAATLPAFTPDGARLVTLTPGAQGFEVWDAATGKSVTGPVKQPLANAVCVSPKGTYLFVAPNGAEWTDTTVYETATGKVVTRVRPARNPTNGTFSPDERLVLIRMAGNDVQPVEAATGRAVGPTVGPCGRFILPQFSSDGRRVLTAEFHGLVRVWNLPAAGEGDPYDLADGGPPDGCLATPDGSRRVAVVNDRLAVLDAAGRPVGPPLKDSVGHETAWLSPDGRRVAIGEQKNGFRVWDTATGEPVTSWFGAAGGRPRAAFDPSGQLLVTAGPGGVSRWRADTGKPAGPPFRYGDARSSVLTVARSPDGRRWAVAGDQNTASVFDADDPAKSIAVRHTGWVWAAAFSPDGRLVATGSGDLTARVWDAATGKPVGPVLRGERRIDSLAFSPDGNLLYAAFVSGPARVWDWRTADVVATLPPVRIATGNPWFSRDGRRVAHFPAAGTAAPRAWSLAPVPLDAAEAAAFLELLTGYRLDETEAIVPVGPGDAHARLNEYRRVWAKVHPEAAAPDPLEPAFKPAAPASPPPPETFTPEQAATRIGETCAVKCTIKSVGRTRDKTMAFLNTHADYRDAGNLSVVIPKPTPDRLRAFGCPDSFDELIGRTIVARGKIVLYSGRLEVVLGDDDHIWVLDPGPQPEGP